ncbi:MAG: TonB-dependent receptor, partial [Saprospiraceae bacterium]|nr:TonB-dependent receptor [Saprospiraceae bacterium]
ILGVNMVYACYRYHNDYKVLLASLADHIRDRVYIDMVRLEGPNFQHIDQRLLPMELVRQGLTQVAIFDKKGCPVHASEFLYKKNVLVVRGGFRPVTLVNMDVLHSASLQFKSEAEGRTQVMTELTLESLQKDTGSVENQDYLDRVNLLNHLGQMVMVTHCPKYRHLIRYLKTYRVNKLGLVIGVRPLLNLINSIYTNTQDGNLLSAYGELFTKGVQMYVYPAQKEGSGELMNSHNMPVPPEIEHLYKHILNNKHLVDIKGYEEKHLHIYSPEVLRMIKEDEENWDTKVTPKVAKYIREHGLFGYPCESAEFEY